MKRTQTERAEFFVRTWNTAKTVLEVAQALGVTPSACRSRASYYRKLGVPLREFQTGRPTLDVAAIRRAAKGQT